MFNILSGAGFGGKMENDYKKLSLTDQKLVHHQPCAIPCKFIAHFYHMASFQA